MRDASVRRLRDVVYVKCQQNVVFVAVSVSAPHYINVGGQGLIAETIGV